MSRTLKLYITGLVVTSALAFLVTSFWFSMSSAWPLGIRDTISLPVGLGATADSIAGVGFWILLTLFASALPVRMPRGSLVSVSIAPIVAATYLGGPVAAA